MSKDYINIDGISGVTNKPSTLSKTVPIDTPHPSTLPLESSTRRLSADKDPSVDFLHTYDERPDDRRGRAGGWTRLVVLILLVFTCLGGLLLFSNALLGTKGGGGFGGALERLNLWQQISGFMATENQTDPIKDRINILLLGMGGSGHDGPYLTDTIIIVSLKFSTRQMSLVSVPRDMIVKYSDGYYPKINEVYTLGIRQELDMPGSLAAKVIGDNFGITIDYYAVVDFSGFAEIVDAVNGVEIEVERAFTDYQYPTIDYKYQIVSFDKGLQQMDGQQALKYVRSRHGNNGEGSDFARSRRQQKLLFAIKEKILDGGTLLNPYRLNKLYSLFTEYVETNIGLKDSIRIYDHFKEVQPADIIRRGLDDGPDGLLTAGITEAGAYILQPLNGFQSLQIMMANIFTEAAIADEEASIEIQNGTNTAGLAYNVSQQLKTKGLEVTNFKNAATRDFQRSIIYDLSAGTKPITLALLQEMTSQALITTSLPPHLAGDYTPENTPDFILILGQDFVYQQNVNQINE
ncbi:MAG: LCP family protein [Candidatus Komeilibacteria bacterium]|nr:LCP family protein [Candidatus Komeilibacteria bacterium]